MTKKKRSQKRQPRKRQPRKKPVRKTPAQSAKTGITIRTIECETGFKTRTHLDCKDVPYAIRQLDAIIEAANNIKEALTRDK